MKDLNKIKKDFEKRLKGSLETLESQRKNIKNRFIACIVAIVVPIIFIINSNTSNDYFYIELFVLITVIISGIIMLIFTKIMQIKYRVEYKSKVIKEVLKILNPEWSYDSGKMVDERDYINSELFDRLHDKYKGDDLIFGNIGDARFQCSEVHTMYENYIEDEEGDTCKKYETIFKGLFMVIDCNYTFQGKTFVSCNFCERSLGYQRRKKQSFYDKYDLVNVDNDAFKRKIVVHSSDPQYTKVFLTSNIINLILKVSNICNNSIQFSFIDTKIYCSVDFFKDLFEPGVFKSGLNFEDIKILSELLFISESIVNELNLPVNVEF